MGRFQAWRANAPRQEHRDVTAAYINRIATVVPPHDVHEAFCEFAQTLFCDDRRKAALFKRMVAKAEIEHRYSCLGPADRPDGGRNDAQPFYTRGQFPDTATRMRRFEL